MHTEIRDFDIKLTFQDVLKGQGVDPGRASDRLAETAEAVLEETHALIEPAAIYMVTPVTDFEHKTIRFNGGSFEGPLVAKAFAGAEHLYIAVCTIGDALENRVQELMGENPVKALALDGAGIAAVGKVSQAVEDIISAETFKIKSDLGMRAQPGQEGWPIEQQAALFSVLPAENIGVTLTESFLMIPRKSVSLVVGRGTKMKSAVSPCDFCSKRHRCDWRREKRLA